MTYFIKVFNIFQKNWLYSNCDEIMFTLGTLAHLLQGTMFPLGAWSHLSPYNLWYVYLNIMFPYDMYISYTFSDYIILQSNLYGG